MQSTNGSQKRRVDSGVRIDRPARSCLFIRCVAHGQYLQHEDDEERVRVGAQEPLRLLRFEVLHGSGDHKPRCGAAIRSKAFAKACRRLKLTHSFTRPYRPQSNGKAERFIHSALREWAYGIPYNHSSERTDMLDRWTHH